MSDKDTIRRDVAKAYTTALESAGTGCCRTSSPSAERDSSHGYDAKLLAEVPAGMLESSFGCGNPLAFSQVEPGQTVVDLGSGAGLDLLAAARAVGPAGRVIGIDMTDAMIDRARENVARSGVRNVEVRKGLIEQLPVEDGSVDWVISNCVINLSPDKPAVFAEIARILRPGGRMLVSDIVAEPLPEWILASMSMYASCVAGAISEADYLDGLSAAGLVDVEVRDRMVYDASAIEVLVRSDEFGPACEALAANASADADALVSRAAAAVDGKIQSLRIFARKPA